MDISAEHTQDSETSMSPYFKTSASIERCGWQRQTRRPKRQFIAQRFSTRTQLTRLPSGRSPLPW